jgi:flagellar biosynthesis/type III secretory pathway protein FliH
VLAEHLDLVRWGRFLGAVTDDEREELAMQDPAIREAKDTLDLLSADPAVQDLVQRRKLALDLHQIDLRAAKAEGRAEGKAEGQAEGEAKGRAEGLRIAVQRLCDVLGLDLDDHKRQELARMSDTELDALSDTLTRERCWPAQ